MGFGVFYATDAFEKNDIKRGEYAQKVQEANNFKSMIKKINPEKFWNKKAKNDISVPLTSDISGGISAFSNIINRNVKNRPKYTYSLENVGAKIVGFRSYDIKLSYYPDFEGFVRTLEDIEGNERLFSIKSISIKPISQKSENPMLNVKLTTSMFSEGG